MSGRLAGKTALITGASRGIGEAVALALGEAGATIALVARDPKQLRQVAEKAKKKGIRAEIFAADVSKEVDVESLRNEVLGRLGAVDIIVNNAGVNIRKPLIEFPVEEWRQVIDTNLVGPFLICRAFVPTMKGRGYGRIINTTSTMSHVATANRTAYAASKAGLLGFTRALAISSPPTISP